MRGIDETDLGELIEKTPGVCGGSARVVGTRIAVWVIEAYRRLGVETAGLLDQFPALREIDVEAALQYARRNPEEIDAEIADNDLESPSRGPT